MADNINTRAIVYDMLMSVEKENTPSHLLLSQTLMKYQYLDKRDRAFISRLFRGTLEYEIFLDGVIRQFSSVRLNKIKPPIKVILRMSVYQILKMDHIPDAAACDEAVKLTRKRGLKNLSGFVNGVLRNISRNKEAIHYPDPEKTPAAYISMRYSVPEWLAEMWLRDYGFEMTAEMGQAMLDDQKTTVRVRDSQNLAAVKEALRSEGLNIEEGCMLPEALHLSGYDYLGNVGPFADGRITAQDESAMLAAVAAGIVCAAPGGKSMHMADILKGSGQVSARDLTEAKVLKIQENLKRTGLKNVSAEVKDALVFYPEDAQKADIVMADLPCSGLGVMGRKADIKRSVTPEKITALAALQREILSVVQYYVKPGGVLVYSTCTVSKAENEENMQWFEEHFPFGLESLDAYVPEKVRNEHTKAGWIQILPGQYQSDGFFIARFRRSRDEGAE
mgnify:FL=1